MKDPSPSWLQVSLEVDAELAESVAEVLARYIEGGIAIESTRIRANPEDQGHSIGPLRVSGYIPLDSEVEETRQKIENALRALSLIRPIPKPSYTPIKDQNWMESWKRHYQPLLVGERLLVLPAWAEVEPGDRLPIRIEPGMAFGTGAHPSTQLSLQLLEQYIKPGQSLIDLGCGSGILSIAAARLGASPILGVDIDPVAVENAHHNAALNQLKLRFQKGSLADLLEGQEGAHKADIVVANILAPVLIRLLGEGLGELLGPDGRLILSGILAEQEGGIGQAIQSAGLKTDTTRRMEDWLAVAASV